MMGYRKDLEFVGTESMSVDNACVGDRFFQKQGRDSLASFVFEGKLVAGGGWVVEKEGIEGFVGVVIFPIFDNFGC